MIRSNLLPRRSNKHKITHNVVLLCLVLGLLGQVLVLSFRFVKKNKKFKEFEAKQLILEELEKQAKILKSGAKPEELAGFLVNRNNWIKDRKNVPLRTLAKLERTRPRNIELLSYEEFNKSGVIQAVAPDMNQISRWLNGVFGANKGNLNIEGKNEGKLLFRFVWSG